MLKICSAPEFLENHRDFSFNEYVEEAGLVRDIIHNVRQRGDEALKEYSLRFDGVLLEDLRVSSREIEDASAGIDPELGKSIEGAAENIRSFHRRQLPGSWWDTREGVMVGQLYRPLDSVGVYVPGGTAAYPSSLLMTVVPAVIAGVKEIFVCTPPAPDGTVNPVTLFSAREAGATAVFKAGGAQAVAAMVYGTETIPRVQKIFGPGNIYVTLAKKEVFGEVGVDLLAGPSEIMVLAGDRGRADYIAADLLSQAEHGAHSRVYLVTTGSDLAREVVAEVGRQLSELPRGHMAERALLDHGAIIVVSDLNEAWEVVNRVAPEHLEILLDEPWRYLDRVQSAGSIFLGEYTPEPVGDYWAGTNHVLPTGGTARFASPLGVTDYLKSSQVLYYSRDSLDRAASRIVGLARAEGLEAHARAIEIRRKPDGTKG